MIEKKPALGKTHPRAGSVYFFLASVISFR